MTVTVEPKEGYEVEGVTVTDKNGNQLPVTQNSDGSFSFVYEGVVVTIEAKLVPLGDLPTPPESPFTDVKPGDWFYEAVVYMQEKGLMTGISDADFAPDLPLSRGMLATILWRAAGQPTPSGSSEFSDLTQDWYKAAVAWASENGIVFGLDEDSFGPDADITREQLAVMLWRFAQQLGIDVTMEGSLDGFSDGESASDFATQALRWAVAAGILNGDETGALNPGGNATRAEAAVMLQRFLENVMLPAQEEPEG